MTSTTIITTTSVANYPGQAPVIIYNTTNTDTGVTSASINPPSGYVAPSPSNQTVQTVDLQNAPVFTPTVSTNAAASPLSTTSVVDQIHQNILNAVAQGLNQPRTSTAEAAVVTAAGALINGTNPPINVLQNQSPVPTASGVVGSVIEWVKANPVLAAALGLAVVTVGGIEVIKQGSKILKGTDAVTSTSPLTRFKETYQRAGKTITRRKYNREPKTVRHRHHRKLKFGSAAYRKKYLGHK